MGYLRDMLDMLTGAYNRTDVRNAADGWPMETNTGRLFSVYAGGLELVHEHADKVLLWDTLDHAKGAVLDRYGANFGVDRQGTPDGFYRLMIKIKMIALLSGGDVNTVIQSTAALLDIPIEEVDLDEVFPAKVWVYVDQLLLTQEQIDLGHVIARMLKRIVACGVGFRLFFRVYDSRTNDLYLGSGAAVDKKLIVGPPVIDKTLRYGLFLCSGAATYARITAAPPVINRTSRAGLHIGAAAMTCVAITSRPV